VSADYWESRQSWQVVAEAFGVPSGNDVRIKARLQPGNLVLELQLSLFQPPNLNLIYHRVIGEALNDVIEVTMLGFQFQEPLSDDLLLL
jgi:hypothetical protein